MNQHNCERIQKQIQRCTVRIEIINNGFFGTGFFISRDIICTAKHILDQATSTSQIIVKKDNCSFKVIEFKKSTQYDVAFLQINHSNNIWLILDNEDSVNEKGNFYSFGITKNYLNGEPISIDYSGFHFDNNNNKLLSFKGDIVSKGQSGSAVIQLSTNKVVGMLIISKNTKDNIGGRAIPSIIIISEFFSLFSDAFFVHLSLDNEYLKDLNICSFKGSIKNSDFYLQCAVKYLKKIITTAATWEKCSELFPYLHIKYPRYNCVYLSFGIFVNSLFFEYKTTIIDILKEKIETSQDEKTISEIDRTLIYLKTGIVEFSEEISRFITRNINELNKSLIAGSFCLRQNTLFSEKGRSNLLVPFEWTSRNDKQTEKSLANYVKKNIQSNTNCTIIADPGIGKSTFSKSLFFDLLSCRRKFESALIPIYIDLHNEISQDVKVGSKKWIHNKLISFYGHNIIHYCSHDFSNIVLIIDSLDEYFLVNSKDSIDKFFSSFLIDKSIHLILTCRISFFDRYLNFRPEISKHNVIELLPWKPKSKNKYISNYLKRYQKHMKSNKLNNTEQERIITRIKNSVFLREISTIPLWLNMTLEIFSKSVVDEEFVPEIDSLVELYSTYTVFWLRNEYIKANKKYDRVLGWFDVYLLIDLLSEISWFFYEDTLNYNLSFSEFSEANLLEFLFQIKSSPKWAVRFTNFEAEDIRFLKDFIVDRTLLIKGRGGFLKFIHKSFQEYLVSWYMFSLLIDKKADYEKIAECHEKIISPEVSEFIKGQIQRVQKSVFKNRLIFNNCKKALELIEKKKEFEQYRARIGVEQLTYNLGMIKAPEVMNYLKDYLQREKDLWIIRGITIGLSFNGDDNELNEYVDRLYQERGKGGLCPENDVNIGFSLSFFGDQPFDDYHPDIDQNLPACKHTVERLVYQLSTIIDKPSWRPNLYTLLDLQNRDVSKDDYWSTMKQLKNEIHLIVDSLEKDTKASGWPETKKMRILINEL